jgi:hypothetical protein
VPLHSQTACDTNLRSKVQYFANRASCRSQCNVVSLFANPYENMVKEAACLCEYGSMAVLLRTIAINSLPVARNYGEVAGLLGKVQQVSFVSIDRRGSPRLCLAQRVRYIVGGLSTLESAAPQHRPPTPRIGIQMGLFRLHVHPLKGAPQNT